VTDETTARQRTGGLTTLARHGREHFAAAGRKGGTTLRDTYGSEHLSTMGKTGGEQTRNRHGHEHFVEAGRKGGLANRGRVNTKPSPLRGRAKVPRVPDAMLSDLRARIQLSGLTQMELAARLGVTQPMLSRLLQGQQHTCVALGGWEWPGRIATLLQTAADDASPDA
jgi:general stress protein YciG